MSSMIDIGVRRNYVPEFESNKLPALQLRTSENSFIPSDPGLATWSPTHQVTTELPTFSRKIAEKPASTPMDWFMQSNSGTIVAHGSRLSRDHPTHPGSSEPAWSHSGSDFLPAFRPSPLDTDSVASGYDSNYGYTEYDHYSRARASLDGSDCYPSISGYPRSPAYSDISDPEQSKQMCHVSPRDLEVSNYRSSDDENEDGFRGPEIFVTGDNGSWSPMHHHGHTLSRSPPSPISPTDPRRYDEARRRAHSGSGASMLPSMNQVNGSRARNGHSIKPKHTRNNSKVTKPPQDQQFHARKGSRGAVSGSSVTRPFLCTFDFAGCQQTFASKNEWKRHVASQHMLLYVWKCDVDINCSDRKTSTYNRKDLFGQHLKRMHAPKDISSSPNSRNGARPGVNGGRPGQTSREMQEFIANDMPRIQDRCRQIRRNPPPKSRCGFCLKEFTNWEHRMEHVGRHIEKHGANGTYGANERHMQDNLPAWTPDLYLIAWAESVGIIVKGPNGGWTIHKSGKEATIDDS